MAHRVPFDPENVGLLVLRLGMGAMFLVHGWEPLSGGKEEWLRWGSAASAVGLTFLPAFWGFMHGVAEFVGGLCVMGGFLFRTACFLLVCNMTVAVAWHFAKGDNLFGASHAIEAWVVFMALLVMGPGRHRLGGG